jgi:para-nitrobenzyl esterase
MAADRRNFSLDIDEVRRRLERFMRSSRADIDRIIDAYRGADPGGSASDLLAAITTDFTYRRNTTRHAALQAAAAGAPAYAYVFDWKTPVWDGLLRSPHTVEVPFVFGTGRAASGLLGTGPEIEPLTRTMIATWSAFARTGDPNNSTIPQWPRYEAGSRATMMLDVASRVESNPGGATRAALDGLPYFEYSMPINFARP